MAAAANVKHVIMQEYVVWASLNPVGSSCSLLGKQILTWHPTYVCVFRSLTLVTNNVIRYHYCYARAISRCS